MPTRLHRPEPVSAPHARRAHGGVHPEQVVDALLEGQDVVVVDHYRTGAEVLERLSLRLPVLPAGAPHADRVARRREQRQVSLRLLAPIVDHQLALEGAEPIGFLRALYPREQRFLLPFADVQALHHAWRTYHEGVHLAVLGRRVHPFYGAYVPHRTSHLELFGTWLSQYTGARSRAIDVGTGCGVLAWMLARAGFGKVAATDVNPNAIESVARDLKRHPAPITLFEGDLLAGIERPVDLVVFNPPWIPGPIHSPLDQALYFDDDRLFERFFDQARAVLRPGGRVVVLFSDIGSLVRPDLPHPIETELARGHLREVQVMRRRVRPPKGSGRRTRERVEVWELARAD